ncbi:transposon Ty3-I Gag-Pol polyprotein isoform X1 [Fagus crenata]
MTPARKERNKKGHVVPQPEMEEPVHDVVHGAQNALEVTVEMLRRQLTTLTKEVRRNQLGGKHRGDGNDNEDTLSVFENPYGNPRREERKWEPNIKIELPEFYGSLNPNYFVDWLNQTERIFEYYDIQDPKKVKLVSIKLRGRASAW